MERNKVMYRTMPSEFTTRDGVEDSDPVIEGYFAVFNSTYDMGWGMSESIAPGAFADTISGDVRALIDHDTRLVLGRTIAHTLELREDAHGLWGRIHINPRDSEAMNLYERVKRGDVSQCSFGFEVESEETTFPADGEIHWTIKKVKLYEVSCCTYPAYEDTSVSARRKDWEQIEMRKSEAWKSSLLKKLKGAEK
nr:MAG TPA: prohead serine protease [Caudoviricetes sp.]